MGSGSKGDSASQGALLGTIHIRLVAGTPPFGIVGAVDYLWENDVRSVLPLVDRYHSTRPIWTANCHTPQMRQRKTFVSSYSTGIFSLR